MIWKDVKLATLQKMFAAEGSAIPTDESVKDYIAGMTDEYLIKQYTSIVN